MNWWKVGGFFRSRIKGVKTFMLFEETYENHPRVGLHKGNIQRKQTIFVGEQLIS